MALILPPTVYKPHEYLGYAGLLFNSDQGKLFGLQPVCGGRHCRQNHTHSLRPTAAFDRLPALDL